MIVCRGRRQADAVDVLDDASVFAAPSHAEGSADCPARQEDLQRLDTSGRIAGVATSMFLTRARRGSRRFGLMGFAIECPWMERRFVRRAAHVLVVSCWEASDCGPVWCITVLTNQAALRGPIALRRQARGLACGA